MGWGKLHTPAALPLGKRSGTCTGGWVGPGAGLDGCRKPRNHRVSIPGPSVASSYTDPWYGKLYIRRNFHGVVYQLFPWRLHNWQYAAVSFATCVYHSCSYCRPPNLCRWFWRVRWGSYVVDSEGWTEDFSETSVSVQQITLPHVPENTILKLSAVRFLIATTSSSYSVCVLASLKSMNRWTVLELAQKAVLRAILYGVLQFRYYYLILRHAHGDGVCNFCFIGMRYDTNQTWRWILTTIIRSANGKLIEKLR
jgi:hypothetical protein